MDFARQVVPQALDANALGPRPCGAQDPWPYAASSARYPRWLAPVSPPLVGWASATAREPCPETCPQLGNYDPAERDLLEDHVFGQEIEEVPVVNEAASSPDSSRGAVTLPPGGSMRVHSAEQSPGKSPAVCP